MAQTKDMDGKLDVGGILAGLDYVTGLLMQAGALDKNLAISVLRCAYNEQADKNPHTAEVIRLFSLRMQR